MNDEPRGRHGRGKRGIGWLALALTLWSTSLRGQAPSRPTSDAGRVRAGFGAPQLASTPHADGGHWDLWFVGQGVVVTVTGVATPFAWRQFDAEWDEAIAHRAWATLAGPALRRPHVTAWIAGGPALVERYRKIRDRPGGALFDYSGRASRDDQALGAVLTARCVWHPTRIVGIGAGASVTVGPMRPISVAQLSLALGLFPR